MGIGLGVFFLALGAILVWAVTGEVEGVDLTLAGVILMVAGAVSLLWGLVASTTLPWHDDSRPASRVRTRDRV